MILLYSKCFIEAGQDLADLSGLSEKVHEVGQVSMIQVTVCVWVVLDCTVLYRTVGTVG